jgi:hypothetical protein
MPFEQLRELVVSLTEPECDARDADAGNADDDAVAAQEFETRPTICLPGPRTSTIDQLIAALRHPEVAHNRPPPRRRVSRR